ncbi:MAG: glycosyltransferase [Thermomicrobiales bacterium]|nr:glycosyltransferase [Thermomicrobiales bacterium]
MHIGVIAPPWFSVPPAGYGGIERVVFDQVESFIDLEQQVTLFASEGSRTRAELVPLIDEPPGFDQAGEERAALLRDYGHRVRRAASAFAFDVIYDHTEIIYDAPWGVPVIRTIHGPANGDNLDRCRQHTIAGEFLLGISHRQVELFASAAAERFGSSHAVRFAAAIHNPIDVTNTPFFGADAKDVDAAYIGRCHPDKGPVEAIEIAMRAGVQLRMAMRVSAEERSYFETEVKPLLETASGIVEYVGEVTGRERDEFFGRARTLLFSSVWEEPFGLVLTESLARGTPVAALRRGSAPEIIQDRLTGVLCSDCAAMADRVPEAMSLDPQTCREEALGRFDRMRIAERHLELIQAVATSRKAERTVVPLRRGPGTQNPGSVVAAPVVARSA